MIRFTCEGTMIELNSGESFARPKDAGFRDTPATELLSLIAELEAGRPWRDVVRERYAKKSPWLYKIITEASRTGFFPLLLNEDNGPVLDLGAGWGQIARPLAKSHSVIALEPVAERSTFIQSAALQDGVKGNMYSIEADYFNIQFETPLSAILSIGVMEWMGANQTEMDPQARQSAFLNKARSELKPDGKLIIAIENRLGLKYLMGCPDDHIGKSGIACLPDTLARKRYTAVSEHPLCSFTYSYIELQQLLVDAGFSKIEFYGAFPDYKLSSHIIPFGPEGDTLNNWVLDNAVPIEHDGYHGTTLSNAMQNALATNYRRLAAEGRAHHFVPSFFVTAQK